MGHHPRGTYPSVWKAVTKSDTVVYDPPAMMIYHNGNSELTATVEHYDGSTSVIGIPRRTIIPGCFRRILATGTTGDNTYYLGFE